MIQNNRIIRHNRKKKIPCSDNVLCLLVEDVLGWESEANSSVIGTSLHPIIKTIELSPNLLSHHSRPGGSGSGGDGGESKKVCRGHSSKFAFGGQLCPTEISKHFSRGASLAGKPGCIRGSDDWSVRVRLLHATPAGAALYHMSGC